MTIVLRKNHGKTRKCEISLRRKNENLTESRLFRPTCIRYLKLSCRELFRRANVLLPIAKLLLVSRVKRTRSSSSLLIIIFMTYCRSHIARKELKIPKFVIRVTSSFQHARVTEIKIITSFTLVPCFKNRTTLAIVALNFRVYKVKHAHVRRGI